MSNRPLRSGTLIPEFPPGTASGCELSLATALERLARATAIGGTAP